ncbi:nuclear transport factor 2 family protein [Actinomadura sp. 6N118]|uniref:nuclear transport factor 2 family protein n=1 Tax=Actinomadura sp. 6N118 TaxID=3375151 RepID=UPI0037B16FB5
MHNTQSDSAHTDGTRGQVEAEIVDQHRFIEAWLRGDADRSAQAYGTFVARHTPDFVLNGPGGDATPRDGLMAGLEGAHGAMPGLVIEIRDVRVLEERDNLIVAVYEEHQTSPAERSTRRSTVVFVREGTGREGTGQQGAGLRWRHLHETWIESPHPA